MITVTFIRHGQSEDNLKTIWAGWKDAPLSALGQQQADAAGKYFSSTKIATIYTSPSLRAHATAKAILTHQPLPPPLIINPKLREQHFGEAEGNTWSLASVPEESRPELYSKGIYPVFHRRDEKFPGGESLDDIALRAEEAVAECILPHLAADNMSNGYHIVIASHGLCISELVAALLRLDPTSSRDISYTGLFNTAWIRAEISLKNGFVAPADPKDPPSLNVKITHVNVSAHLDNVKEHSPVEESASEAEVQKQAYFGGGGAKV